MGEYKTKILELNCSDSRLNVELQIQGQFNATVREPKITIVFNNGEETRRLPLLVKSYFPNHDQKEFTIYAKYTFRLNHLFYKKPYNEEIRLAFEFVYGEEVSKQLPFTVSDEVQLGVQEIYETISCSSGRELLIKTLELPEEPSPVQKIIWGIRILIKGIWDVVLLIIAIALIPVYLVESVLALIIVANRVKETKRRGIKYIPYHVLWRMNQFMGKKYGIISLNIFMANMAFKLSKLGKIKENRIVFLSNRRGDLTGNFEFVYKILKEDQTLDIRLVLEDCSLRSMSLSNVIRYGWYCGNSKVILVDDYINILFKIPRREGSAMIQLWHACGAFKTFGFSRLGKSGGSKQDSIVHRIYDKAIVSSQEIAKFYAEGFGLGEDKIVATGIPRTDIFFDEKYRINVRQQFYDRFPYLKNKKILLFAPTFRGNGKISGYYPVENFDVVRLFEALNGEYAILIKHHPFVEERNTIPVKYEQQIIDVSENSELNDFLFVTDLLITDYSSVVFEAALLDVPMLFYAYDLLSYTVGRGFYYDYEKFVPGKIVSNLGQVIEAIKNKDFETEKIQSFKNRFFDHLDGKSSQRVTTMIKDCIEKGAEK